MKIYTILIKSLKPIVYLIPAMVLVSCGSSQGIYDEDGIYAASKTDTDTEAVDAVTVTENSNSLLYKNYFERGSKELTDAQQRDSIFTDIDSYSSEEGQEIFVDATDFNATTGYGAWGDDIAEVDINIYNNSPFIGGFGYGRFGYGGFGFNNFGYNGYFGMSPFWSPYWNVGFNRPFYGYAGYYGYGGFYNPYNFYGNNFYGYPRGIRYNNGFIAYNRGRRSSLDSRNTFSRRTALSNSSNSRRVSTRSRATYSRNRNQVGTRSTRGVSTRDGVQRRGDSRVNRSSTSRQNTYSRSSRSSRRGTTTSRSSSRTRPSASRTSGSRSSSYGRSSSSSSRGSSARSSGSSSRSTGGGRSSSSRGGGRRG